MALSMTFLTKLLALSSSLVWSTSLDQYSSKASNRRSIGPDGHVMDDVLSDSAVQHSGAWFKDWLVQNMGERQISVAVTPNGYVSFASPCLLTTDELSCAYRRADAITRGPGNKQYFAEPHTQMMDMASFLQTLSG